MSGYKKLKPLSNAVNLKSLDNECKTTSGLYLPDVVNDDTQKGVVISISVGDNHNNIYYGFNDTVVFKEVSGYNIYLNCERHVINAKDILSVELKFKYFKK